MSDKAATLDLEPQGDDFVLRRIDTAGIETSITLSPDDVLTLAQSAPRMKDRIHAARTPKAGGHPPVSVTPVAQCGLNSDIHVTEVHLQMTGRNGAQHWFALPHDVAKALADALPRWVAKLEAAAAAKKVQ